MRKCLGVFCLTLLLVLASCTSNALAELDAIVSAAEAVLPATGVSPGVIAYIDAALKITDDVLATNGNNPQAVAAAVADFNKLVVPQIDASASPQTANLVNVLSRAVQNFVNTYQTSAVPPGAHSLVEPARGKAVKAKPLSDKEKRKLVELRKRLADARARLHPAKK